MSNRKNIVSALTAAFAAMAVGGGVAIANAAPPAPLAPLTTMADAPEPGDTPDEQGPDTDNVQDGDQGGPELPDTAPPAPAPR